MKTLIITAVLFFTAQSQATTVGVVDSGFYMEHLALKNQVWSNSGEIPNRIDSDQNGYVDDIHGWNFAENNKYLFDISQVKGVSDLTYKLMSIAAKLTGGIATPEEEEFIQKNLIDLPKAEQARVIAELNFYGQYAHGTHVAGVIAENDPEAELLNLRFFPAAASPVRESIDSRSIFDKIQNFVFGFLAQITNQSFNAVGNYLSQFEVRVVNMSLGIPTERFAAGALFVKGNTDPSLEEIAAESQKIFKVFEKEALVWLEASPKSLFVAAAGNSGLDNDQIPAFPANVDHPNVISVAATIDYNSLPEFSNYGLNTVDVAAPGVAIKSAAPGPNLAFEIEMSGTSMAAPFVAGVASKVISVNPALTAAEVKRILLETVDFKPWLEGKVLTSGVVNRDRALMASELSLTQNLEEAISASKERVSDQIETRSLSAPVLSSKEKSIIYESLGFN